jgi:ribulose kinase
MATQYNIRNDKHQWLQHLGGTIQSEVISDKLHTVMKNYKCMFHTKEESKTKFIFLKVCRLIELSISGAKGTWKPLKVCYLTIKCTPYDKTKSV